MSETEVEAQPAEREQAPAQSEPKFTQADLDRVVSERVTRERAKFGDYADMKSKAARLEKIEAANRTELEKAVERAKGEGRTEALSAVNQRLVAAEVRALAAAAKFRDPTDAIAQLRDHLPTVGVGDDGSVDAAGVKSLLDDLAKAKPYLVADERTDRFPDLGQGRRQETPNTDMNTLIRRAAGRG